VLSLAASAAVFIYSHLRRPPLPVIDLKVIDLADPGNLTVLNSGNVDVLMTDLVFYCQPFLCAETNSGGHEIVKAGEVHTTSLDNGAFGDVVPGDPLEIVRKVGGQEFGKDYAFRLYMAGHASTWLFKQIPDFKTMPAKAVLFYVPTSSTAQAQWHQTSVEISLEAVLVKKTRKAGKARPEFHIQLQQ
jgi:hypothetical protein